MSVIYPWDLPLIYPWFLGEGLPNVRYTGVCHRPGSIFTSRNPEQAPNFQVFSRTALIFKVLLQNRILFVKSGLERQKNPVAFLKNDKSGPNFLSKKYAHLLAKDIEYVPVTVIMSKLQTCAACRGSRLLFPAVRC